MVFLVQTKIAVLYVKKKMKYLEDDMSKHVASE